MPLDGRRGKQMRLDEQVAAVDRALEALRQAADRAAQLLSLGPAHGAAPLRVQPRGIQPRAFLRAAGGVSRRRPAWLQCRQDSPCGHQLKHGCLNCCASAQACDTLRTPRFEAGALSPAQIAATKHAHMPIWKALAARAARCAGARALAGAAAHHQPT